MPPGHYFIFVCLFGTAFSRKSQDTLQNEFAHSNNQNRETNIHDAVRYSDTIDIDNNQGQPIDGRASDYGSSGEGQRDAEFGSGNYVDDEDWLAEEYSGDEPDVPERKHSKCEELRDSVKSNPDLQGAFIPRCATNGDYQSVQCDEHNGQCWCVNKYGQEIQFTRGNEVNERLCRQYADTIGTPPIKPPKKRPGTGSGINEPTLNKPDIERPVPDPETDDGFTYEQPKPKDSDTHEPGDVEIKPPPEGEDSGDTDLDELPETDDDLHTSSIIGTPGLLPGIIGGAVVGLLCAVLLVMFIVYRMRKKDEGSYALEEPKMTSPSRGYTRAPTKEYWA